MPTETKKLFTVEDYYRMAEAGILPERPKTELINGEIIEVTSMGARHAAVVSRINELFASLFKGKVDLRPQLPIRLNDFNEPQPDIALLAPRNDRYSKGHPRPSDVLLVLEIADTSMKYDREVKLPIYAHTGIRELWIVDLSRDTVLVYRDPAGRTYGTQLAFTSGQHLSCLAFPEINISVEEMIGDL